MLLLAPQHEESSMINQLFTALRSAAESSSRAQNGLLRHEFSPSRAVLLTGVHYFLQPNIAWQQRIFDVTHPNLHRQRKLFDLWNEALNSLPSRTEQVVSVRVLMQGSWWRLPFAAAHRTHHVKEST
jgi:hypothetical protein